MRCPRCLKANKHRYIYRLYEYNNIIIERERESYFVFGISNTIRKVFCISNTWSLHRSKPEFQRFYLREQPSGQSEVRKQEKSEVDRTGQSTVSISFSLNGCCSLASSVFGLFVLYEVEKTHPKENVFMKQ